MFTILRELFISLIILSTLLTRSRLECREKQRTPSWTDRILWLSMKEREVSAENYTTHLDCSFSDHKPVSTILCLPVRSQVSFVADPSPELSSPSTRGFVGFDGR